MSAFEGFKAFNFDEGVPYASVTKNGVTFNKSVVKKLDCCEYVVLLINADEQKMALQKCSGETQNSVQFCKSGENTKQIMPIRWNTKGLMTELQSITGWDLSKDAYRIDGSVIREEDAVLFDLSKARLIK